MDLSTAIALAAAGFAFLAALFASRQADAAEAQTKLQAQIREDQAQPYVWADIRMGDRAAVLMTLVVHNEGPSVATDVRVHFLPGLPRRGLGDPTDLNELKFAGLPPGRTMRWNLTMSPEWLNSDLPKRFEVTIDAVGPYGPCATNRYVLDVSEYMSASAQAPGTLGGLTDEVKKILKVLEKGR